MRFSQSTLYYVKSQWYYLGIAEMQNSSNYIFINKVLRMRTLFTSKI